MRHLDGHENVLGVRDVFPPTDMKEFKDVYLVTDLMESDLHKVLPRRCCCRCCRVSVAVVPIARVRSPASSYPLDMLKFRCVCMFDVNTNTYTAGHLLQVG